MDPLAVEKEAVIAASLRVAWARARAHAWTSPPGCRPDSHAADMVDSAFDGLDDALRAYRVKWAREADA